MRASPALMSLHHNRVDAGIIIVTVANVFTFGFACEGLFRGLAAGEVCEYPLDYFLGIQALLIVALQFCRPMCVLYRRYGHGKHVLGRTNMVIMTLFMWQWAWLGLGWLWMFTASNCVSTAPYLNFVAFWLTVIYSIGECVAQLVASSALHKPTSVCHGVHSAPFILLAPLTRWGLKCEHHVHGGVSNVITTYTATS